MKIIDIDIKEIQDNEDIRHSNPILKSLDRHIKHNIKYSAINYQVIKTVNGYKLINIGIVLVNKDMIEKAI